MCAAPSNSPDRVALVPKGGWCGRGTPASGHQPSDAGAQLWLGRLSLSKDDWAAVQMLDDAAVGEIPALRKLARQLRKSGKGVEEALAAVKLRPYACCTALPLRGRGPARLTEKHCGAASPLELQHRFVGILAEAPIGMESVDAAMPALKDPATQSPKSG